MQKKKNSEKVFCFWDNCILIGSVKFSLLSRKCLSLTPNVLTNSLRILCITKRIFSMQLISQLLINSVNVLLLRLQQCFVTCCLSKSALKHGFLDIYRTIFLGAVISRNTSLRGSSFVGKCLKFNIDFKDAKKILIKSFLFFR